MSFATTYGLGRHILNRHVDITLALLELRAEKKSKSFSEKSKTKEDKKDICNQVGPRNEKSKTEKDMEDICDQVGPSTEKSKTKKDMEDIGDEIGPSNEVLPTIRIYAALIILVLGLILGKFFL